MDSDIVTYRRSDLHEKVWKDPVRTVARAYGISDVWLAKICRRLSVRFRAEDIGRGSRPAGPKSSHP